ncbi:MAG: class I SAM-dependent methyltransferase [Tannerella sp.]|jgi:SAM-dependent methyltransferase|nr:class I SAM-dependent methyltransferase [Tannerella sp.]
MLKTFIKSILKNFGLLGVADRLRFLVIYIKTYKAQQLFKQQHPTVALPPPYFIYETHKLNYQSYYEQSIDSAKWLVSFLSKYASLNGLSILDWGCGPGRIIRHLPDLTANSCRYFASDYNGKYINWCTKNIHGVDFVKNDLKPPLPYSSDTFDIIYGMSIFTHLSEKLHFEWFEELMRVMKKGGILFLTLHGEVFLSKLTEKEKIRFRAGQLTVQSSAMEGHRTFSAYQPDDFMMKLIGKNELVVHEKGIVAERKPQQDVWIIRKS